MAEKTTTVQIVMPQHCNGYARPRLLGGQIMAWIDVAGAVAARRYTHSAVTTVCIDNLNFLKPAYLNDPVSLNRPIPASRQAAWVLPDTVLLPPTEQIYQYFEKRKISRATVDAFHIAADEKGMSQFDKQGIKKFVSSLKEYDIDDMLNRVNAVSEASSCKHFVGGTTSKIAGETKIIFKTKEIEK